MGARISKYFPIAGVSYDIHKALPPTVPPIPPPTGAPIPACAWIALISNQFSGLALTGKWSLASVQTEGLGDIIWMHDWGILQTHIPILPVTAAANIPLVMLKSSTKYYLPAFSTKQPVDGTISSTSPSPIAVSTPAFLICTMNCQDWFPSLASVSFQLVSTRWVGFTMGDFAAGLLAVGGEAIKNLVGMAFGDVFGDSFMGTLGNALMGPAIDRLVSFLPEDAQKPVRYLAGAFLLGIGGAATPMAGQLLTNMISDGAEILGGEVAEPGGGSESPPAGGGGAQPGSGGAGR